MTTHHNRLLIPRKVPVKQRVGPSYASDSWNFISKVLFDLETATMALCGTRARHLITEITMLHQIYIKQIPIRYKVHTKRIHFEGQSSLTAACTIVPMQSIKVYVYVTCVPAAVYCAQNLTQLNFDKGSTLQYRKGLSKWKIHMCAPEKYGPIQFPQSCVSTLNFINCDMPTRVYH